jgi:uncharacterized protein involved in propanediol utilization
LVAVAHLSGWNGPPLDLARACLAVEGATDPLMFKRPERLLWASRRAAVIAALPPLPRFDVLGGFWGAPLRTDPADLNFPDISELVQDWSRAAQAQDLGRLALLATQSAQRTLALRGANGDPTAHLAHQIGALGHMIAHTGSARGFIFARGHIPATAPSLLRAAGLRGVLAFSAGGLG